MQHLKRYQSRDIRALDLASQDGWRLKRYAIIADNRVYDPLAVDTATQAALSRLPPAGAPGDEHGNHGVGFQLFHFAEQIPLVSPVFYWGWGSVLFNAHQIRSYSDAPYKIVDGIREVVGCVWEMELVSFETRAWRDIVLTGSANPEASVARYLETQAVVEISE